MEGYVDFRSMILSNVRVSIDDRCYFVLIVIILLIWLAMFSFVIQFLITKQTSCFVNPNEITKLISHLGLANDEVRNISANHCARGIGLTLGSYSTVIVVAMQQLY